MKLPTVGAAPAPSRPTTHKPLSLDRMMRLAGDLEDAIGDSDAEVITPEVLAELAQDRGVDRSHLLAASVTTELGFDQSEATTFVVCVGKCQSWGALERVEQLLELQEQRRDAGGPGFNVHVRSCLDKCEHACVIDVRSPDGSFVITEATEASVAEAAAAI